VAVLVLTSAEFWDERALITVARGDGVPDRHDHAEEQAAPKSRYALEAAGQRVGTIVAGRGGRYTTTSSTLRKGRLPGSRRGGTDGSLKLAPERPHFSGPDLPAAARSPA
jgi:hypothetical protein